MKPFRVYIGFDPRDDLAYKVCERSLRAHASVPVEVWPLKIWELRRKRIFRRPYFVDAEGHMWDDQDRKAFSTEFSYTRFCVPMLESYGDDWVLFMDADMLWRGDIAELIDSIDPAKALMCVQHDHQPEETSKATGIQQQYRRKNWSSVMAMKPSRCSDLTLYRVNRMSRDWLHGMCWLPDDRIGALDEKWNWLESWSPPGIDPAVVHYTLGTPDFPSRQDDDVAYADEWWRYAKESA